MRDVFDMSMKGSMWIFRERVDEGMPLFDIREQKETHGKMSVERDTQQCTASSDVWQMVQRTYRCE